MRTPSSLSMSIRHGVTSGGYRVHPLPLLIAEGNGRGGGDYDSQKYPDLDKVGIWARNLIRVSDEKPAKGYKELKVNFKEC